MPLELLQDMREFVLRGIEDIFRLGLTSKPSPLVAAIQL